MKKIMRLQESLMIWLEYQWVLKIRMTLSRISNRPSSAHKRL
ncbi:uncharacterized protein METZ01_LOCUS384916, partial [marine metagenome]